jgi:hypothetical protein
MNRFRDWGEPERLVVNVDAAYREFERRGRLPDPMRLFDLMANAYFGRGACSACRGHGAVHSH